MPNLQVLDTQTLALLALGHSFTKLRQLIIHETAPRNLAMLLSFFSRTHTPNLRHITFASTRDQIEPAIEEVLSAYLSLEVLELLRDATTDTGTTRSQIRLWTTPLDIPPSIYAFLVSSTTLRHLSVIYPSAHTLFQFSPLNLESLRISWPRPSRTRGTRDLRQILTLALGSCRKHAEWIKLEVEGAEGKDI